MTKRIAKVILNNTTRQFDKEYDYIIPEELKDKVSPGVRVIVPFGKANKEKEGYILGVVETTDINKLKNIKVALDRNPILNKDLLELVLYMKRRYICTYCAAIKCILPPGISMTSSKKVSEKKVRVAYLLKPKEEVIYDIEHGDIDKIQRIRVLEMLLDNEYIATSDIINFAGVSSSVLNTLNRHGYIDFKYVEVIRKPFKENNIEKTLPLTPTKEQEDVLNTIKRHMKDVGFKECLIHGVTGSGKTEVYLQLIQFCLDMKKEAIVLVPEISLTPQMVERFRGRFGENIAVLHSRLSMGEKYDQWRLIKDGKIKVAVGARSAIFAPFEKLGIIIIDEEHEASYKSEIMPKYHVRDVAKFRAQNQGAVVVYGSATPSEETYHRALIGEIEHLELNNRANNMILPNIDLVDMRKELEDGQRSIFSRKLIKEIHKNIKAGEQTILFLNRRGHSSFTLCRNCGYTPKCICCDIALTYHKYNNRYICHYCGYTTKKDSLCPQCGSDYIGSFGIGTQKIEEETLEIFKDASVIRMDMDTTACKNSHEEILNRFRHENINILIGTQMIAKGHDFPNVTLVGVLAADTLLNVGDYNASERTFGLLTQVSGRAGRGIKEGRVVIQSYNIDDYSIVNACRHDYKNFFRQDILIRKELQYPPFTNLGVVILSGENDKEVFWESKNVKKDLEESFLGKGLLDDSVKILGVSRAPLAKIKNKYRWRIIIKCKNMDNMIEVLSGINDKFRGMKKEKNVEISMDINPLNMI